VEEVHLPYIHHHRIDNIQIHPNYLHSVDHTFSVDMLNFKVNLNINLFHTCMYTPSKFNDLKPCVHKFLSKKSYFQKTAKNVDYIQYILSQNTYSIFVFNSPSHLKEVWAIHFFPPGR